MPMISSRLKRRIKRLKQTDLKRPIKFFFQRLIRGFDDRVAWCFYSAQARWSLPRLKHFRKTCRSTPHDLTLKEWHAIIDEIIWMFENDASDDGLWGDDKATVRRYNHAEELFKHYRRHLWD